MDKRTPSLRGEVLGADTTGLAVARVGTYPIFRNSLIHAILVLLVLLLIGLYNTATLMCVFFQHFLSVAHRTAWALLKLTLSTSARHGKLQRDVLHNLTRVRLQRYLQRVKLRIRQLDYTFIYLQSQNTIQPQSLNRGGIHRSQINIKTNQNGNHQQAKSTKSNVPGAGVKPLLMARWAFLLHSLSFRAAPSHACVLCPPIDGADPVLTTTVLILFQYAYASCIALAISTSLWAPAGQVISYVLLSCLVQNK